VEWIEAGSLELLSSAALVYEIGKNQDPVRRDFAMAVVERAVEHVEAGPAVEARSTSFVEAGARPLDALHLASAVEGGARYFATTDDQVLRTANRLERGPTEAVSLLHLIEEVSHGRAG
jgi:predicted nucleic acid-binding protein